MASMPTQEEILAATRKSQEAMIAAIKSWLETVRTATPKLTSVYAPLTDKLPKLPSVGLPFADKLPTPEEAVASAYHTAEQLLANQRRFTEELLKAMTPLIPGRAESPAQAEPEVPSRSAWQDAVAASEPKTVAASAAPIAAPARPEAKSTPARPAPRTTAAKRTTSGSASKSTPAASARRSTAASSARKSTSATAAAKQTKTSPAPKDADAS